MSLMRGIELGPLIGKGSDVNVFEILGDCKRVIRVGNKKGIKNHLEPFIKLHMKHPNILNSEDIIYEEEKLKYIEEKGVTVDRYVKKLKRKKRLEVCLDICKGIRFLHLHNILHGDIKPDNIIVVNGKIKVSDFSFSKYLNEPIIDHTLYTYLYKPPEVLDGEEVDLRSDIYALGCTIYELIHSTTLFKKTSMGKIKCFIKSEDVDNLILDMICKKEDRIDIEGVITFINKLLNKKVREENNSKSFVNILHKFIQYPDKFTIDSFLSLKSDYG